MDESVNSQQEWRGSIGGLLTDANHKPIAVALNIDEAHKIADAHSAALAAERQKVLRLEAYAVVLDKAERAERQRREADAQALDGLGKLNDELHKQLLSAQAAIEKALETIAPGGYTASSSVVKSILESVDLSLLQQHEEQMKLEIWRTAPDQPDIQEAVIAKLDLVHRHAVEKAAAEVRKPLVDVLAELKAEIEKSRPIATKLDIPNFGLREIGMIDDALAKVKE